MKTNKKAILGFAVAMVFSLAIMQGISTKNNQDVTLQQVSIGAGYMAGSAESSGATAAWVTVSGVSASVAGTVAYGALVNSWNPAGWVGWAVAGGAAL
ncbi:MAG: hypothetical protein JEZ09_18225 [Salinivirgaceae bacterium]|nr:hypothetical protein [Salinivirgaceae bacterium]